MSLSFELIVDYDLIPVKFAALLAVILCKLSKANLLRFLLTLLIVVGCKSLFNLIKDGDGLGLDFCTFDRAILRISPIDSTDYCEA